MLFRSDVVLPSGHCLLEQEQNVDHGRIDAFGTHDTCLPASLRGSGKLHSSFTASTIGGCREGHGAPATASPGGDDTEDGIGRKRFAGDVSPAPRLASWVNISVSRAPEPCTRDRHVSQHSTAWHGHSVHFQVQQSWHVPVVGRSVTG